MYSKAKPKVKVDSALEEVPSKEHEDGLDNDCDVAPEVPEKNFHSAKRTRVICVTVVVIVLIILAALAGTLAYLLTRGLWYNLGKFSLINHIVYVLKSHPVLV